MRSAWLFGIPFLLILLTGNKLFSQQLNGPDGYPLENGHYLINRQGDILSRAYQGIREFSEGLAVVHDAVGMGLIDKTGKEVVRLGKYNSITAFKNGRAIVERQNGKHNVIDHNGNELLKSDYDLVLEGGEGLYPSRKKGKAGYVDSTGKVILPFIYDYCFAFNSGLAPVRTKQYMHYIDKSGKIVLSGNYNEAWPFNNGLAEVSRTNEGHGVINTKGEFIIPIAKDSRCHIHNGIVSVERNGKTVYLNSEGKEVPKPKGYLSYTEWYDLKENANKNYAREGMFPVQITYGSNTYYGYADSNGTVKIPPVFFRVYSFKDGVAVVNFVDQDASDALTLKLREQKNRLDPLLFEGACTTCRGRGQVPTEVDCKSCGGKGFMHKWNYNAFDKTVKTVSHTDGSQTVYYIPGGTSSYSNGACSCGGSGKVMMSCYTCNGKGK